MGVVADSEVRSLRAKGLEAFLACPRTGQKEAVEYILSMPCIRFGNAARLLNLKKMVQNADVVHLHYPFYGTAGMIANLRHSGDIKHLAVTLHMDAYAKGLKGLLFNLHRRFCQTKIISEADVIFVSSLDYIKNSSYAGLLERREARLVELPFGVNADAFCPGEPCRNEFDIPTGATVIGSVAVLDSAHMFKGIDILIKAISHMPEDVHLLMVGDGDMRCKYMNLAHNLGLGKRVHFTGRLDQASLIRALRTMDIFAFPSLNGAEAFGLAMLEAMSCGIPVVASDLHGVRSVGKDAGLIVPPGDLDALIGALRKLSGDESLRKQYAGAARAKAIQYNWDKHAEILISHYQRLCGLQL